MAREDVLPQLIRTLMRKEGPPEESDNSILQKMIIPYDQATLSDNMTAARVPSSSFIWGSFSWSMSQWGAIQEKMLAPQDTATVSDSILVTKLTSGSQTWGGFSWGMNQWVAGARDWSSTQNNTWNSVSNTPWNSM